MKKSRHLVLVLMGSMALAGCGSSGDSPRIFQNKAECVSSGSFTEEQCAKMEADALEQSPKFASREDCAAQFGADSCREGGGGSFWMPALMGFMAGHMLGNSGNAQSMGLYRNPSGGFQTATGQAIQQNQKSSPIGRAVSRGGFSSGGRAIGA